MKAESKTNKEAKDRSGDLMKAQSICFILFVLFLLSAMTACNDVSKKNTVELIPQTTQPDSTAQHEENITTPTASPKDEKPFEVFAELGGIVSAGILFDENENILVGKNGEILKINPQGEITTFVSFKDITPKKNYFFSSPLVWDMVMDDKKNIFAAAQDRIIKISESGEVTTLVEDSFDGFLGASGLEMDPKGNLYFTNGSKIVKYTPEGEQLVWLDGRKFGFNSFFSLRFDPGYENLYATDFDTSSLVKITLDADGNALNPQLIIREPIKNARPYGAPLNMVFSRNGDLYSSLDCRSHVLKVDKDGNTEIIRILIPAENHFIAFGGKGFDENSIYVTSYNGKSIYKLPFIQ